MHEQSSSTDPSQSSSSAGLPPHFSMPAVVAPVHCSIPPVHDSAPVTHTPWQANSPLLCCSQPVAPAGEHEAPVFLVGLPSQSSSAPLHDSTPESWVSSHEGAPSRHTIVPSTPQ